MSAQPAGIPSLFHRSQTGCVQSSEALYDLSFHRLRGIAAALMRKESPGHTLPPTALVSELFLKLRCYGAPVLSEEHFFRVAARAMRQVLVDHSRTRNAKKRVTNYELIEMLPSTLAAARKTESHLAVAALMKTLKALDSRAAEAIYLRHVEGLKLDEIASFQDRPLWKVRNDLKFGIKWLTDRYNAR